MCSWETPSPSRDACDNPRTCRLLPRGIGVSLGCGGSGAAALGHSSVFWGGGVCVPYFPALLLLSKEMWCRAPPGPPKETPSASDALQFSKTFNTY